MILPKVQEEISDKWKSVGKWIRDTLLKEVGKGQQKGKEWEVPQQSKFYTKLGYDKTKFDTEKERTKEYERLFKEKFNSLSRLKQMELIEMSKKVGGRSDVTTKKVFEIIFS